MDIYLITGGAGFIGSNFINMLLQDHPGVTVINYDKLTYAGSRSYLEKASLSSYYRFIQGDICCKSSVNALFEQFKPDYVINFAAESHVDRSIRDDEPFIRTNVMGTQALLQAALQYGVKRFLQVSTDEVYGAFVDLDAFTEASPLKPGNPYAASKASADLLALSYHHTFGLPILITRSCNNYGPCQHLEKLIPMVISNCLKGARIPVYGDGQQERDWMHVDDHCRGVYEVLQRGVPGNIYNISANNRLVNINLIEKVIDTMDVVISEGAAKDGRLGKHLMEFVEDRKGHDRGYSISSERIRQELGWSPKVRFEDGLRDTVRWYVQRLASGCDGI